MKLNIFESAVETRGHQNGTYVEAYLNDSTKEHLQEYCNRQNIPNPTPSDKFHITIIYSQGEGKGDESIQDKELEEPIVARFEKFNLFGENKDCLVMELESEELVNLHKDLLEKHPNLEHSYDPYAAHVTLSYSMPEGFDVESLTVPDFDIIIEGYTSSELDPDWKSNNNLD